MSDWNYPPGMSDSQLDPLPLGPSTPDNGGDFWCAECGHRIRANTDWVEGHDEGDYFCGRKCKYRYDNPDWTDEDNAI